MSSKSYRVLFPHDDVSIAFIKFLDMVLVKAKFEKIFERMDPGGVDVSRYQNKKGQFLLITRSPIDQDNDELKISSDEIKLKPIIERAANAFGRHLAQLIKTGRQKR